MQKYIISSFIVFLITIIAILFYSSDSTPQKEIQQHISKKKEVANPKKTISETSTEIIDDVEDLEIVSKIEKQKYTEHMQNIPTTLFSTVNNTNTYNILLKSSKKSYK